MVLNNLIKNNLMKNNLMKEPMDIENSKLKQ